MGGPDGRFGRDINRLVVLDGRLPRAEDEVVVTFVAAQRLKIHAGDTLSMQVFGPLAFQEAFRKGAQGPTDLLRDMPPRRFHVTGIVAMQGTFPPSLPSGAC